MPIFRKIVGRLADRLRGDRKVTYRAVIDPGVARYLTPLLDKIVADDEEAESIRLALVRWCRAERPPIAIHCGEISTCRIDGPWQVASGRWFPLGGLILCPGVTAHLSPFDAKALHELMQEAIEDTILAWVLEHDLYSLPHGPAEIDRRFADPVAKAMIAASAFAQREADAVANWSPGGATTCCSDEPVDALCAACRKGPDHG